jgi:hypothetical protein
MRTSMIGHAARAFLLLTLTASPLAAFDATGTWEGQFTCKNFNGAKTNFKMKPSTLLISQSGTAVSADIDGGSFRYNGRAMDDAKKPAEKGEIFLVQCGTDNDAGVGFAEMVRLMVKTKAEKGSFNGLSIIEGDFGSGRQFATCKYKFKRTGTTNPSVPGCSM